MGAVGRVAQHVYELVPTFALNAAARRIRAQLRGKPFAVLPNLRPPPGDPS